RALSKASGKDVWPIASTFLDQRGVPLVKATLSCEKDKDASVSLTQARYRARPSTENERNDAVWKIPICIAYEGGAKPACGILDGPSAQIPLGQKRCPRWIYPNAEDQGYFLFALQPELLNALVDAGKGLDVRSRIGLVSDAWALVQSGDLGAD